MRAIPLLHGEIGFLDELLMVGIVLLVLLFLYFLFAVNAPKERAAENEKNTDETN